MLNATNARQVMAHVIDPVAKGLIKIGLGPDAITIIGTVGSSAAALYFFPQGKLWQGCLVIVLFIFSDMLDGTMARMLNRKGSWGAFLDSTLDRVTDGAIFAGLLIWFVRSEQWWMVVATTISLIAGTIVSYAKARAEGLGMTCNVGIAERSERLIVVLVAAFFGTNGLGVPFVQEVLLWFLAAITVYTVFQRMLHVRQQAMPKVANA